MAVVASKKKSQSAPMAETDKPTLSHDDDDDGDNSSVDMAFASLDFAGVDFDTNADTKNNNDNAATTTTTTTMEESNLKNAQVAAKDSHATRLHKALSEWEEQVAFADYSWIYQLEEESSSCSHLLFDDQEDVEMLISCGKRMAAGRYADILNSSTALRLLASLETLTAKETEKKLADNNDVTVGKLISKRIQETVSTENPSTSSLAIITYMQWEWLAVAALHLFWQINYTGPTLEWKDDDIMTYRVFAHLQEYVTKSQRDTDDGIHEEEEQNISSKDPIPSSSSSSVPISSTKNRLHQALLAELAVDGEWPCQMCRGPSLLLLSLGILNHLATTTSTTASAVHLWQARALQAQQRLFPRIAAPPSLTTQLQLAFTKAVCALHLNNVDTNATTSHQSETTSLSTPRRWAAILHLEWGLASYHGDAFEKEGRQRIQKAQRLAGLSVKVTGAVGKRTKFQQQAVAQMLVQVKSLSSQRVAGTAAATGSDDDSPTSVAQQENQEDNANHQQQTSSSSDTTQEQEPASSTGKGGGGLGIAHGEDGILLERIKFDQHEDNQITILSALDQSILLALCLDVKNSNPTGDELTAEEMGAFLARVLDQYHHTKHHGKDKNQSENDKYHDDHETMDWMIHATALLERAWLEFERSHARERAILQMQALADQHLNRLTMTQSTQASLDEAAPAQDRLRHLSLLVYPPRWGMLHDLADRYARMGIVTSAAELYAQVEAWEDVVDCYTRAGKVALAKQIVRERLATHETPRMWVALGKLTNDPEAYRKAIDLSRGRFSAAYAALGQYHFDQGENLTEAASNFKEALRLRPLMPQIWFRLGTISMQLERWGDALHAFTQVVQQEPEEGDAWANVAAVHMHNRKPVEAYPALLESLKYNRRNWRVWVSKLYICLDLNKHDEAIHACQTLMDLGATLSPPAKDGGGIPPLEEKCIRAIVGGSLQSFHESRKDEAALDAARRTLSRVDALLDRIAALPQPEPAVWVLEITTYFHTQLRKGDDDEVILHDLMQEYRALQSIPGWEKDDYQARKMCALVTRIVRRHREDGSRERLVQARMLTRGVLTRLRSTTRGANDDTNVLLSEVNALDQLLSDINSSLA